MSPRPRSPEASAALRVSLVDAARRIVTRDGPGALTMRSVAAEADCAVGLPYKVFADRTELVAALIGAEFQRVLDGFQAVVAAAGTGTVAGNLERWAHVLLDSPALALAGEVAENPELGTAVDAAAGKTGAVRAIEDSLVAYLGAEQRRGRVAAGVDVTAFAFLLAGAVHNLVAAGPLYPRPSDDRLAGALRSLAATLAPPALA